MSDVTEADRERAREVAAISQGGDWFDAVNAIAAALAEERAKARMPFLALADEAERKGVASSFRDFAGNPWPAQIYPHDIRRVAEASE